jgi:uncharacterized protein YbjT (DUF2867 family)
MKITVTGSLGNISRPMVEQLVARGHQVHVITSNATRAAEIHSLGAVPLVGQLEDDAFMAQAFRDSDAVYLMVPPNFQAPDYNAFTTAVQQNYVKALTSAGVRHVVNLSSIGSALAGQSPLDHYQNLEAFLDKLSDVNVLHLRPGGFYSNFYGSMDMIRHMGIVRNNFPGNVSLMMSDPRDIAEAAVEALHTLSFQGKSHHYIISDRKTGDQVAQLLGAAVGKPDLKWVEFSDEQLLQALLQHGFSKDAAQYYIVDMGIAIREGLLERHYASQAGPVFGRRSFEAFAKEFAFAYAGAAPVG